MSTPIRYVTEPTEPCPRWPEGATDVTTIPAQLARVVDKYGDKNALMYKTSKEAENWTPVTWKQFSQNAMDVAKGCIAQGMTSSDSINILAFNSPEWLYCVYGAIQMGGIPAGIYGTTNPDGCRYVADHSKAKIIFVDTNARLQTILSVRDQLPELKKIVMWSDNLTHDKVPEGVDGVLSWDDFIASGKGVTDSELEEKTKSINPATCTFLSYTSGTTGRPKAVMHSHDTIIHAARCLWGRLMADVDWGSEEKSISYLPLSHVAASLPMFCQTCCEDFEPDTTYFAFPDALKGSISATIKEVQPTTFVGVPRVWEKFYAGLKPACGEGGPLHGKPSVYARGALGLQACKKAIVGAAPVENAVLAFFDSIDLPVLDVYGMTENFALSHCNTKSERKYGSVGKPVPGGEIKLADQTAEILVKSRSVMLGYMYNKEKTEEAIDENLYLHTGDIGAQDDNGFYNIIGRIKEIIITSGGENCAPVLLESALKKALPAVSNVMMVGDKRKFVAATFTLHCKPTAVGTFTDELDGPSAKVDPEAKTIKDAQASAIWKKYIDDGVAEANKEAVSNAQQTKKWIILSHEFSIPTGELGPTLKLKRNVAYANFEDEINSIYTE